MFFETYKDLCKKHGEKPYGLPVKLGAKSNSIVAQWKSGSLPRPEMLQSIADYFGVSVGYLIDGKEKSPSPDVEDGLSAELQEIIALYKAASPEVRAAMLAMLRAAEAQSKALDGGKADE